MFRRNRPVDASEVLPGLLVGSAPDSSQCRELSRRGVTAVVDLRAEVANEAFWSANVTVKRVPLIDRHAPALDQLVDLSRWVVDAMNSKEIVLIHCHAGMGRAATVACAVLMELGYELPDAYNTLREARSNIAPTEAQIALLRQLDEARRPAAS